MNGSQFGTMGRPISRARDAPEMGYPLVVNKLFLVIFGVLLNEFFLVLWHILKCMNRVGSAGGHAGAAIDAAFRIYIHLSGGLEAGFVCFGMDTVRRADFNAEGIFDTGIGNYIGHDESISA